MAASTPTLLFVTNFSETSTDALTWAIREASKHKLHVSVLYPYRLNQQGRKDSIQSKVELEREAIEKFEQLEEKLLRDKRMTYDFKAEIGFLRDRVQEFARKHRVAIIVIGNDLAKDESFAELVELLTVPLVIVPRFR